MSKASFPDSPLSNRDKVRSLIETQDETNIILAFELAKSINKYEWVQEDFISCFDLLLPYFWVPNLQLRDKMMQFDDLEKVRHLQNLEQLRIYDLPKDYLTERLIEVIKIKDLNIVQTPAKNIPSLIFNIPSLESLNISNLGMKEVPKEIGQSKNLKNLDLHFNQLTELPDEIVQLEILEKINLVRNQFTKFPEILFQLPNLKKINFEHNPLGNYECYQINEQLSHQGVNFYYKSSS